MPTEFFFKFCSLIWTKKLQSQSPKHSTVTSQTQISVIQSQNQQQPIVSSQQLFQHSSQRECSPADVGSNERRQNLWPSLQ